QLPYELGGHIASFASSATLYEVAFNHFYRRVFYFRPGHETYPVYKERLPLKIVENAVRWLGNSTSR
ncbi:MAG: hypothetical protein ABGZ17_12590, partial [Planctomycetaceae bacterium]